MLFFGVKNSWFRLGIALALTVPAISFAVWMRHNFYVVDPYNPNLEGTAAYGHNGEGAFAVYGLMTLVEYVVLLAVLLPFSFSRFYFARIIVLQAVYGFWFFAMIVSAMHSGGLHFIHALWLLVVNGILFLLLVTTIIAEVVGRNESSNANYQ